MIWAMFLSTLIKGLTVMVFMFVAEGGGFVTEAGL